MYNHILLTSLLFKYDNSSYNENKISNFAITVPFISIHLNSLKKERIQKVNGNLISYKRLRIRIKISLTNFVYIIVFY